MIITTLLTDHPPPNTIKHGVINLHYINHDKGELIAIPLITYSK
jgi:hypothetical protein